MPFSREKDLWRYASKNLSPPANGTNSLLQQPRHHPPRHPPQARHHYQQQQQQQQHQQQSHQVYIPQSQTISSESCYHNSLLSCDQQISNTPLSPYSQDYLLVVQQPPLPNFTVLTTDREQCGETAMRPPSTGGCRRESNTDDIFAGSCGPARWKGKNINRLESPLKYSQRSLRSSSQATAAVNTITTKFATVANMIRNFCGTTTFADSDSVTKSTISIATPTTTTTATTINDHKTGNDVSRTCFRKLMKMMKGEQKNELLEAVKSRIDSCSVPKSCCILLPRSLICGELPYVVASRLFFWSDLRDETELKPLPICPCDRDPVYVCCNPLHWCRILETETAPPPYRGIGIDRVKAKGEGSEITGNTITASTDSSNLSLRKAKMNDIYANDPNSLTTQGEERQSWCQVAYWELDERVGNQCCVQKSAVSIYDEGSCSSEYTDEMCLKDLAAKKVKASSVNVENTRQKIGLGIILSQEEDGVWLYNRSTSPIFVLSPTLSENWSSTCVCRVTPGSCLKAFDYQRAQSMMYSAQSLGAEVGPINIHSMCISFIKGWGDGFKRQYIMTCPCWIEVLFTQR